MDKIYLHKLIKMAIAAPLAISLALVLNLDLWIGFLSPLFLFIVIWLFPDPIGLKGVLLLKLIPSLALLLLVGAFTAGLWGINSLVVFLFILLTGWALKIWMPSIVSMGFLNMVFFPLIVLVSSTPYTTAVNLWLLMAIGFGVGWLVDRLFWPIFDQQGIERQVSGTFHIFQELSDYTFQCADVRSDRGESSISALTARAVDSIRAANKALKTAAIIGKLLPSDRDAWSQAIALQVRLLEHLLAIHRLLQDNRENLLLQELETELSALGHKLSATFAGLSVAIVNKHPGIELPSPNIEFQHWQNQLNSMRAAGRTEAYNLVQGWQKFCTSYEGALQAARGVLS